MGVIAGVWEGVGEVGGDVGGDSITVSGEVGADITPLFGTPGVNLPGWGLMNPGDVADGMAKVCCATGVVGAES